MMNLSNYTLRELSAMDDLMEEITDMLNVTSLSYDKARDFFDFWERITSEMKYKEEEENA